MTEQIIRNHAVENSTKRVGDVCLTQEHTQLVSFMGYIVKFERHIHLRGKSTTYYNDMNEQITTQAVMNSTHMLMCVEQQTQLGLLYLVLYYSLS